MVKAPSSHGLDRKFKPWRKGKSQNSKRRSSLKQQLRGLERLLNRATDKAHRESIDEKIRVLKEEIAAKQEVERERENAKQSHGTRFIERQKLVRMEKSSNSNPNLSTVQKEEELLKTALDQVYVAHYPMEVKYLPLFRQGVRRVDPSKVLEQRAKTRRRILSEHFPEGKRPSSGTKSWISEEQYNRVAALAKDKGGWSVEQEREIFGEVSQKAAQSEKTDDRFTSPSHHALLAAAEQAEAQLDEEVKEVEGQEKGTKTKPKSGNGSSDASSSASESSDDDKPDPLKPSKKRQRTEKMASTNKKVEVESGKDASPVLGSSSEDDSSTSSSSSSDSSSSDSSDNEDDASVSNKDTSDVKVSSDAVVDMEDDDFLVPLAEASDDANHNVFAKPKERMSAIDEVKGDKSQGWATQQQGPNQYNKQKQYGNNHQQNRRERRR